MSRGKNVSNMPLHIPGAAVQNDEDCLLQQGMYGLRPTDNRAWVGKQELSQCCKQSLPALWARIFFIQQGGEILFLRVLFGFQANESDEAPDEAIEAKISKAPTPKDASPQQTYFFVMSSMREGNTLSAFAK